MTKEKRIIELEKQRNIYDKKLEIIKDELKELYLREVHDNYTAGDIVKRLNRLVEYSNTGVLFEMNSLIYRHSDYVKWIIGEDVFKYFYFVLDGRKLFTTDLPTNYKVVKMTSNWIKVISRLDKTTILRFKIKGTIFPQIKSTSDAELYTRNIRDHIIKVKEILWDAKGNNE